MVKIISGDKSDNITPICKKLGKKLVLELATDSDKLKLFLQNADEETNSNFIRNKKLIDLSLIPHEITEEIIKNYEL